MIRLRPLDQQVMVVMGASSGIGRETALRAAAKGARLIVSARDADGLESLVSEIRGGGGEAEAMVADVVDPEQMRAVAARAVDSFGGLDTWVHAAAVALYARFEQTSPEEFRRVVEVNLLGQVHGALAALPHLRRRGRGALIHISSLEARRTFPYHSAYGAAKHGIDGFLEALRVELRQEGVPISVTNILPGSVNTPLFDKARTKIGVKPMPIPPIYQPGTVADVILHAAVHPARELVAGGAAKGFLIGQRLSPRLLDVGLVRIGFRTQRADEPKDQDAPCNLFGSVAGMSTSEGPFSDGAWKHSAYNWLELRSPLRALGSLVSGPPRLLRDQSEPALLSEGRRAPRPHSAGSAGGSRSVVAAAAATLRLAAGSSSPSQERRGRHHPGRPGSGPPA
jgi:NAD(P)-dependent dehydrogenase (short-subunit alcohol dehydrogenase family)